MEEFNYIIKKVGNELFLKQYIYRVGSYHYNWHKPIELLVILNGEVEVCTNGTCRILETDDVILVNSYSGHATLAHEPESIVMLLHMDPTFLSDYYRDVELLSFDLCSTKETRDYTAFVLIRSYLSEMILSCKNNDPTYKLLFESKFYSLMHTIIQYFPPREIQSTVFIRNQKRITAIEKMLKYIDKNYKKKITLDILAKESGYNSNYISQLFKSTMGINFHDYLTRIRLREATRDLSQTEYKILDIALENGFSDIKSFNSAFKKNFGKSPTDYRKRLNKDIVKIDVSFKKQFISVDDTLVNNKLKDYISTNYPSYIKGAENDKLNNIEKAYKLKEQITQLSDKFKELSGDIEEVNISIEDYKKGN
ncbi:AraC family transcriptional regulator [Tissierella sp. Yu-01]|uniref:AraC family transcriptional regulator n=1 Tax=Tissierella sp. Yu-01 TaxID=3035694 RepID=UPI00240CF981|nr:AraC family transcriptional regulator [Tissierella sp. Yu-01]WFA09268.1 AraC family transcriptional regulator [Tissierella sp. Yu-01]